MTDNESSGVQASGAKKPFGGMGRTTLLIAGAFLLVLAGAVTALVIQRYTGSASQDYAITQFQDWRLVCPPAKQRDANCELAEDVVADSGMTLMKLSLVEQDKKSRIVVVVPHGVLLDPGLGFAVGDQNVKVWQYETCTDIGCIAFVPLDDATAKAMQGGTGGQVVIVPGNGTPLALPYSLKGFAAGYKEWERASARRNSIWSFLD